MIKEIYKRSGALVPFDSQALEKWAKWGAIEGIDWYEIAAEAYKRCPDRCTTQELHQALIQTCVDKETTKHALMAGKLLMGTIYKQAFGGHKNIPTVLNMYKKMVGLGLWEEMGYTDQELVDIEPHIDHTRDLTLMHSAVLQITSKYSLQNVQTGKALESPSFVSLRMALGVCKDETKNKMQQVIEYYNDFSHEIINTPTPNRVNLGTTKRAYASCCVSTTLDEAPSLAAQDHIVYMMTCAAAGQGTHHKTRSKGSGVRNNTIKHVGKLPYYRATKANAHANVQGGRGGAATEHFNCLDPETPTILRLAHPTTVVENQIRGIDYSFGYHPYFVERAKLDQSWMFVSYEQSPELYEAMYHPDENVFRKLYDEYEAGTGKRIPVKARDIAKLFLTMQEEIGRVFEHNTCEMNRHTPFKDTIYSSNLCQEIGLPTKGYKSVVDLYKSEHTETSGEIGLCNLAAIAAGRIPEEEMGEVYYRAAKMIDNVIDIMDYPFEHLKTTAQARRSIAVGITNLANDIASRGLYYTDIEAKRYIHRLAEKHSFYLHKASIRLAKERGACEWFHKTRYADGWLPIDTANNAVCDIIGQYDVMPWEEIREGIAKYGMRFSVLEGYMPCESSSVAGNTTNSLYPVRELKTIKTIGSVKVTFLAPNFEELDYQLAWDVPTKDQTEIYAVVQRHCGQAISADYYRKFEAGVKRSISMKELLNNWFYRVALGTKTKYYNNSAAGADVSNFISVCDGGGCTL